MPQYESEYPGLDDPRFRISVTQQMAASCTGAIITSLLSEYGHYSVVLQIARNSGTQNRNLTFNDTDTIPKLESLT